MDNNFNQQQAPQQQPVYQQQMPVTQVPEQPVYQQMPAQQMPAAQATAQPVYQQMPATQPVYQQAPKKPSNTNVKELLALILSAVGTVMAVIGSIFTCSCSASKTYDAEEMANSYVSLLGGDFHSLSAVMIVAIIGAIIAAVGVVFAILAVKDKNATVKAGKMAYIAMAIGAFGVMYGILPVVTICGYNCSLDSSMVDAMGQSFFK